MITRTEAYAKGFHEGRAWAQADLTHAPSMSSEEDRIRTLARDTQALKLTEAGDRDAALELGRARGYREIARTLKAGRWGL